MSDFDYVLIDADITAHEAARLCTSTFDWGDDGTSVDVDETEGRRLFRQEIERISEHFAGAEIILGFSCWSRVYWRHALYPDYKRHRGEPDEIVTRLKAWAYARWRSCVKPSLEADDVLGILATNGEVLKGRKVIVSTDKDFLSIPASSVSPKDLDSIREPSEEEADRFHMFQTLTGDCVDNYKGCPGIGPVKANRFLESDGSWEGVVDLFKSKGLTEDDALVQARISRILRSTDWDWKKKEPILWQPPTRK